MVGDTAGIPDSIMGITFLAAGGNIPEMASIVILARLGEQGSGASVFFFFYFSLQLAEDSLARE